MKEDFNRLRLKYHGDSVMMDDIMQRECRYKTAEKLHSTLKCRDFRFPSLAVTEMSTSEDVAEIHATMIPEGSTVLDMTCGLGIDTFHFAKKAASVTAVELDHEAFLTAVHNAKALGLDNVTLVEGDCIDLLGRTNMMFDTIFVDPARRDRSGRHFAFRDCAPNIIPVLPMILAHCTTLIIKASPMIDITNAVRELGHCCEVNVIGTKNECKEVVFIIKSATPVEATPTVIRTMVSTVGQTSYSFTPEDERKAITTYSTPVAGNYLYEPYPATMKSGGLKILSQLYGLDKLNPNTHLYTSSHPLDGFPGKRFEILEVIPFSKQGLKEVSKKFSSINIATRNFPLTAPQLSSKLKVKDGGDKMLFGTTAPDGKKLLVITSKKDER